MISTIPYIYIYRPSCSKRRKRANQFIDDEADASGPSSQGESNDDQDSRFTGSMIDDQVIDDEGVHRNVYNDQMMDMDEDRGVVPHPCPGGRDVPDEWRKGKSSRNGPSRESTSSLIPGMQSIATGTHQRQGTLSCPGATGVSQWDITVHGSGSPTQPLGRYGRIQVQITMGHLTSNSMWLQPISTPPMTHTATCGHTLNRRTLM